MPCLLAFLLIACGRAKDPTRAVPTGPIETRATNDDVLARVDDRVLRTADLLQIDPHGTLSADEVRSITENWVDREILLKIARRRGVHADTGVRWRIEEAEAGVVLAALGDRVRSESADDTSARIALRQEVDSERAASRVEMNPWKMK